MTTLISSVSQCATSAGDLAGAVAAAGRLADRLTAARTRAANARHFPTISRKFLTWPLGRQATCVEQARFRTLPGPALMVKRGGCILMLGQEASLGNVRQESKMREISLAMLVAIGFGLVYGSGASAGISGSAYFVGLRDDGVNGK
jgi:hypothetical protein